MIIKSKYFKSSQENICNLKLTIRIFVNLKLKNLQYYELVVPLIDYVHDLL